jgi:hypothetical protein
LNTNIAVLQNQTNLLNTTDTFLLGFIDVYQKHFLEQFNLQVAKFSQILLCQFDLESYQDLLGTSWAFSTVFKLSFHLS